MCDYLRNIYFYTACELKTKDTSKKLIYLKCDQLLHSYISINFVDHGGNVQQCMCDVIRLPTDCVIYILCSRL